MRMIGNQSPGITGRLGLRQQRFKPIQQVVSIPRIITWWRAPGPSILARLGVDTLLRLFYFRVNLGF
jgi:hypothetical protein